jgi:hypothetical protein
MSSVTRMMPLTPRRSARRCGAPPCVFVRVKSAEQQGQLMQHRTRDLLMRQRTQVIKCLAGAYGRTWYCGGARAGGDQGVAGDGLGWTCTAARVDWRQTQAWADLQAGRSLTCVASWLLVRMRSCGVPANIPKNIRARRPFKVVAVALANKMARIGYWPRVGAIGCLGLRQREKGLANGRMRFMSVRSHELQG